MQTVGGAVIADIGGDGGPSQSRAVERLEVGALMDKAAFDRGGEKGRAGGRHGAVI